MTRRPRRATLPLSALLLPALLAWGLATAPAFPQESPPPDPVQLGELAQSLRATDPKKALEKAELAIEAAQSGHDQTELASAYHLAGEIANSLGDYAAALQFHQHALDIRQTLPDRAAIIESTIQLGFVYRQQGNLDRALEYGMRAMMLAETLDDPRAKADALHNVGIVYDYLGNYQKALEYHQQALALRERLGDQKGIADSVNNIGIMYYFLEDYHQSLGYFERSLAIGQAIGNKKGIASALNNIGMIHKLLKEYDKAIARYERALSVREEMGDKYEQANTLNNLGEVYMLMGRYVEAERDLDRGLAIAGQIDAKGLMRENLDYLSQLYAAKGDDKRALVFYRRSVAIKEQMFSEDMWKRIGDLQTQFQTEKDQRQIVLLRKENEIKQLELAQQRIVRNSAIIGFILVFILVLVVHARYRLKKRANEALAREKDKSDRLLLNILPLRVANELKEKGTTEPESFDNVTVLFSDIVGFTTISEGLDPKTLIGELNDIFTAFDMILEQHECERVKTIGDAYLCVCGMPDPNPRHAYNIVQSAIEIMDFLDARNRTSGYHWEMRIGIHTGRVVGGVVGVKKYIYDVFGDTINTTSRMESNSEAMHINLSECTYRLVKDEIPCIHRGELPVKGKGAMRMYFVERQVQSEPPT